MSVGNRSEVGSSHGQSNRSKLAPVNMNGAVAVLPRNSGARSSSGLSDVDKSRQVLEKIKAEKEELQAQITENE